MLIYLIAQKKLMKKKLTMEKALLLKEVEHLP